MTQRRHEWKGSSSLNSVNMNVSVVEKGADGEDHKNEGGDSRVDHVAHERRPGKARYHVLDESE